MGHLDRFVDLVGKSRLLAPNLKEMTLHVFTGNAHTGNAIARTVVKNHLLALRWMNPNAVIYLRENHGQGTPKVDYHLWTSPESKSFEISGKLSPEEVVAKVMMAARDPFLEDAGIPAAGSASAPAQTSPVNSSSVATGAAAATARRAFSSVSSPASPSATLQ